MDQEFVPLEGASPLPGRFYALKLLKNMSSFWNNSLLIISILHLNLSDSTGCKRVERTIEYFETPVNLHSSRYHDGAFASDLVPMYLESFQTLRLLEENADLFCASV